MSKRGIADNDSGASAGAALRYGVRDQSVVQVRVAGDRELVFGDVVVWGHPNFAFAMHVDTDETNAANARTGARAYIAGIPSED